MRNLFFLLAVLIVSCGKRSSIELPMVDGDNIQISTKLRSAYIYHDESEKDSAALDKGNFKENDDFQLKIDKRLTLRQVIPIVQELQSKVVTDNSNDKQSIKSYYACKKSSDEKKGFIEFSNVVYHFGIEKSIVENHNLYDVPQFAGTNYILSILFENNDSVSINSAKYSKLQFLQQLKLTDSIQRQIMGIVYLKFNENLSVQEYLNYKSLLSEIKLKHATISSDEYIFR